MESKDDIIQQIASQAALVRDTFESSLKKRQAAVSSTTAAAALHMANLNKRRRLEKAITNNEAYIGGVPPSLSSKGHHFHSAIASFTLPEPKKKATATKSEGITLKSYPNDIVVNPNDVIQGNGKTTQSLYGNKRYRVWIDLHSASFAKALSMEERIQIATSVVNTVTSTVPQGRFLAMDVTSGFWYEMGHESAVHFTMKTLMQCTAVSPPPSPIQCSYQAVQQNTFVSRAA